MLKVHGFNTWLAYLAAFTIFFPYSMPFHLASDIQPLAGFVCLIYLLLCVRFLRVNHFIIFFLFFSIFWLFNFNSNFSLNSPDFLILRKSLNFIYAFIFLFFGFNFNYSLIRLLNSVLFLFVFLVLLQLFLPYFFNVFSSFFVDVKIVEIGVRGVSGFSPEPTDFGFTIFFVYLFYLYVERFSNLDFLFQKFLLFILGFLTFSGSAAISLSLVLFFEMLFGRNKLFFSLFLLFLFLFFVFGFGTRGTELLYYLFSDFSYLYLHTSFSFRFFDFLLGFLSIFHPDSQILGFGVGSKPFHGVQIGNYFDVFSLFYDSTYLDLLYDTASNSQFLSSFGSILFEAGYLGLLFLIILFFRIIFPVSIFSILFSIGFFLFLFQSFPIAFPLPWFLLGLFIKSRV